MTPIHALSKYWGYSTFRDQQEEIVHAVLEGKDVFALMPTGGGKSITFQLPAVLKEGVAIVISPLIALMKDQVHGLRKKNIKAAMISSENSPQEIRIILDNARYGHIKMLYISPERFFSENFRHHLSHLPISFFAIDEAHCISEWGHDFRPSYLSLGHIKANFPDSSIIALTATATVQVQKEIIDQLRLQDPKIFTVSLLRNNLTYQVQKSENKWNDLYLSLLRNPSSSIVFCPSRKLTYELSNFLNSQGLDADFYHARIDFTEKERKQKEFIESKSKILCATNAFGMGIDKPDIRTVYHIEMPTSIEAYFQEVGRAGRDGLPAKGILLYNDKDKTNAFRFFKSVIPSKSEFLHIINRLYNYYQIANNELSNKTFSFSQRKFVATFELNKRKVKQVINFLDSQGVLSVQSSENGSRAKILLPTSNWVSGGDFEHELLDVLARTYPGIFQEAVHINEHQIAYKLKTNRNKVRDTLHMLSEKHQLTYIDASIIHIKFLHPRDDQAIQNKYWPLFKAFHGHKFDKLADAHFFASNKEVCSTKLLLRYFGEKTTINCGECAICKNQLVPIDDLPKEILNLLGHQSLKLNQIVSQLLNFSPTDIADVLQKLVDEREIVFNLPDKYSLWKNH